MKKCKKCGEFCSHTERHHVFPAVWYSRGKRNMLTVPLCHKCHAKVEQYILAVESFMGEVPFGTRYHMAREHYITIANILKLL